MIAGFFKRLKNVDQKIRSASKKVGDKILTAVGKGIQTMTGLRNSILNNGVVGNALSQISPIAPVLTNAVNRVNNSINYVGNQMQKVGTNQITGVDAVKNVGKQLFQDFPSSIITHPLNIGRAVYSSITRKDPSVIRDELRRQFDDTMRMILK